MGFGGLEFRSLRYHDWPLSSSNCQNRGPSLRLISFWFAPAKNTSFAWHPQWTKRGKWRTKEKTIPPPRTLIINANPNGDKEVAGRNALTFGYFSRKRRNFCPLDYFNLAIFWELSKKFYAFTHQTTSTFRTMFGILECLWFIQVQLNW